MNQMQKFQNKWKKGEADRYALASSTFEKREDIPGVQALQDKGGLKEAAAVFTEEGLQIFAQLFANTVERAIENQLNQIVEAAIERKMTEIFEIAAAKIRTAAEQLQPILWQQPVLPGQYDKNREHIETIQTNLIQVNPIQTNPWIASAIEQDVPAQKADRSSHARQSGKRRRTIEEQANILAAYLQENGKQRVCDLVKQVENVYWSTNPWIKISQFCKINSHIRKLNNGYYEYVDKPELMQ
ncbi:hypothetical protein LSG31_04735 [Fodinisporobacter ferrooxydans]|uniref:Uncharacterized protein n=1 Tax=Fodinisporobacter ferrooxydans TaxID=2901836 RepID=A0ABY4CM36_9BACL|nr:hypothetical protein LSG31_04735 [Alicyclobacillaceae bacterium MYW30-H2]